MAVRKKHKKKDFTSKAVIQKVKALYEMGKPLRKIAEETGIGKSTVGKWANEEGWVKEVTKPLIIKEAKNIIEAEQIEEEKEPLSFIEKREINIEVRKEVDHLKRTNNVARGYQELLREKQLSTLRVVKEIKKHRKGKLAEAKTPEEILTIMIAFDAKIAKIINEKNIRDGVEANDKASVTLGINDRFATTNNIQINNTEDHKKDRIIDATFTEEEALNTYVELIQGD